MDLTPKPSTPWWSIFSCCRPPSTPSTDAVEPKGQYDYSNVDNASTAPSSLKVVTWAGKIGATESLPDSPVTACTDSSADVSFENQEDDFIRGPTVTKSKDSSLGAAPLLPCANVKAVQSEEKEDDFIGDVLISTPRCFSLEKESAMAQDFDVDEKSDLDDANCWYGKTSGFDEDRSPMKTLTTRNTQQNTLEDADDIPDLDFPIMKPRTSINNDQNSADGSNMKNKSMSKELQLEMRFYQCFLIMHHIFGHDLTTNIFNPNLKWLLIRGSSGERREFRKMMKLRTLQFKDDMCEVVPRLNNDEGSSSEIPVFDYN